MSALQLVLKLASYVSRWPGSVTDGMPNDEEEDSRLHTGGSDATSNGSGHGVTLRPA